MVPVDDFRKSHNHTVWGPWQEVGDIAKKKRTVILLKTPLIKEDNDAFES
jgi:hypothetical protein